MAQLITLTLLGICVAIAILLGLAALVLLLLESPKANARGLAPRTGRAIGAVMGAMLLPATLILAHPALLDPLCDDFEWFGAPTVSTVRHYAYVASAPIERVDQLVDR